MIVPVPSPRAGALIIGESVIAYLNHNQPMRCTAIKQTNIMVRMRILGRNNICKSAINQIASPLIIIAALPWHGDLHVRVIHLSMPARSNIDWSLGYQDCKGRWSISRENINMIPRGK